MYSHVEDLDSVYIYTYIDHPTLRVEQMTPVIEAVLLEEGNKENEHGTQEYNSRTQIKGKVPSNLLLSRGQPRHRWRHS